MDHSVTWISAPELECLLTPRWARAAVSRALEAGRGQEAHTPLRQLVPMPRGTLFVMPGSWAGSLAVKLLNDRPGQADTLPGVVVLFDDETGQPRAILDGPVLTALRTAALAGWATERLARARRRVAVVGAGFQAWYQVEALLDLGGVEALALWNRTGGRALALAERVRAWHPDLAVSVAETVSQAVRAADVVTVVTRSPSPLLDRSMLAAHAHVNAMGAYRPADRECASDVMHAATVYADTREAVLAESGDVRIPIAEGRLAPEAVLPLASAPARPPAGLTVMKSVGAALFDVAAAQCAWERRQADRSRTAPGPRH